TAPGQAPGNVIAASGSVGIEFYNAGATGSSVQGNIIGLGADGSTALGNSLYGLYLALASQNVTIGGAVADYIGIITDPGATGLVIQANFIGTDLTGTLARGNGYIGLEIKSPGAVIGGSTAVPGTAPGNVIAANGSGTLSGHGLALLGSGGS